MKQPTWPLSDWAVPLCFLAAAALISAGIAPAAGFAALYSWLTLPVVSALLMVWWGLQWKGSRWLPSVLLVVDVCAAAGGALLGGNAGWLIAGAAAALAGWELSGHRQVNSGASVRYAVSRQSHVRLLAIVIFLGLVVAEAGLFLHLAIPFWGVFFAGLLILFSLYRFFQAINHG